MHYFFEVPLYALACCFISYVYIECVVLVFMSSVRHLLPAWSYITRVDHLCIHVCIHRLVTFQSQIHHPGWTGQHPNFMGSYSLPRQFTGQGAYMNSEMDHLYHFLPSDQQVFCLVECCYGTVPCILQMYHRVYSLHV